MKEARMENINFFMIMKLKYLFLSIIGIVLLSSCMKDDSSDYYLYGGIGTAIQIKDSDFYFKFDNGKTFCPIGSTFNTDVLKDSARVILSFVLEAENVSGYDYTGRLQYLNTILTKKSINYAESMPDTLGTNEVIIRDGYIYDKYLNIEFSVRGQYPDHYINLVSVDKEQTSDSEYIKVYFMDKIEGDQSGYGLGIICFDIEDLVKAYPGKKGVSVTAVNYQTGEEETYDYEYPKSDDTDETLPDNGTSTLRIK